MENNSHLKEHESKSEKIASLMQGFIGWFLVSSLFLYFFIIILAFFTIGQEGTGNANIIFSLPFFINVIILYWLFSKKKWRGWGMLSAIILNAAINIFVFTRELGTFSISGLMNDFEIGYVGLLGLMNIPFWLLSFQ